MKSNSLLFAVQAIAVTLVFTLNISESFAQAPSDSKNNFTAGAMFGVNRFSKTVGSVYGSYIIRDIIDMPIQFRAGYNYSQGKTDFDGVQALEYNSHGLKFDGNVFLSRGLYLGLGMALQLNWVERASRKQYESLMPREAPNYFTGFLGSAQAGHTFRLFSGFLLNIEAEIAAHTYTIATGDVYFSNSSNPGPPSSDYAEEKKTNFLTEGTIGIVYIFPN
ncbi:MAG: hypothetical protein ABR574_11410 [Cryomorphaceae bacterium]|nr:hypothetical protein [Flavobacteriales bacterium]